MALAVPREKVTAAFLTLTGGYCHDGMQLFRVIRLPQGANGRVVLLEDCFTLVAVEVDRGDVLKMSVARWPEGLE